MDSIFNVKSISQFHQMIGLDPPNHPLVSLIEEQHHAKEIDIDETFYSMKFTSEMYVVFYKDQISGSIGYGRNSYDYEQGTLVFMSPGQVFEAPSEEHLGEGHGWTLLFHPDLLRKSNLGQNMDNYSFFSYEVHEALHLSLKEQKFILEIVHQIREEYSQNIDKHSQRLIISNLELLLNYCTRFYDRQFFTRTNLNKDFVSSFEKCLKAYFQSNKPIEMGIPSVNYFGEELHMSANYLSDLLKKETGKSIKEHINEIIIQKAKMVLLNSSSSIGEIAYGLGFDYPQSFTRLFKNKTGISPNQYRKSG